MQLVRNSLARVRSRWRIARPLISRGKGNFGLRLGYASLIEWLATGLPSESLHLQTTVREIRWEQNRVEVLADTPDGERIFSATRLIVTVPLGVLKASSGSLGAIQFIPALSRKGGGARTSGSWTRDKAHDLL